MKAKEYLQSSLDPDIKPKRADFHGKKHRASNFLVDLKGEREKKGTPGQRVKGDHLLEPEKMGTQHEKTQS